MRGVAAAMIIVCSLYVVRPAYPAEAGTDTVAGAKAAVQAREDARLEKSILEVIREDPFMREARINVRVRGGVVYLWGRAGSLWEKMHATLYAERIEGVVEVHNCVKVHYKWPWEDEACGNCCSDPIEMRQWY